MGSRAVHQLRSCGFANLRQVEDVRYGLGWIEPHVVGLTPAVLLTGELITYPKSLVPVEAERGQVNPECAVLGAERVEVHDDQNRVTGDRIELGVREQRVILDMVEGDVAQLVQSGVQSPDFVEPGDERLQ